MASFFERHFQFNPAKVDRFTYSEIDAIEYYTARRLRNQRLLLGLTVISVGLAIISFGFVIVTRQLFPVFLMSIFILVIGGMSYRILRNYYWHNFSLKTIHQLQSSQFIPNPLSTLIDRAFIAQALSMISLIASFTIALIVPPPPGPPQPPTITPTPSITFTPSATFTPSNTPPPSPTPTFVYYVDSPRTVAVYVCPQVTCEILATLEPSAEMIVVDDSEPWIEIRLADGRIGFIASFLTSVDESN